MTAANDLLQHLRTNGLRLRDETDSDGQLLDRFLAHRDEAAFESLLGRHGPMIWAVCRRVLGDAQDAEDAFQATCLVLVRKGQSVVPRDRVGNWLYGVAYCAARKARVDCTRRREKEMRAAAKSDVPVRDAHEATELAAWLDLELSRLPDKYRAPIVLCDLEGRTRAEAARHLGWPEGTVAGRLARARSMLVKRLAKHGLTAVTPAALASGLTERALSQVPPAGVVFGTRQAALGLSAGSTRAVALMHGVLRTMLAKKLHGHAVTVAIVLVFGAGVGGIIAKAYTSGQPALGQPPVTEAKGPIQPTLPEPAGGDVIREKLPGFWQVEAGTRDGRALTDWEKRGFQFEFDRTGVVRIHRGQVRDQRTFTWAVDRGPQRPELFLTPPDGNVYSAIRVTLELKDDRLKLTWDDGTAPKRGSRFGPNPSRLMLSRLTVPDDHLRVGLEVAPAPENVVGSRLAGTWEPDPDLNRRLGRTVKTTLTITNDPTVATEVPAAYREMFAGKQIYLAGRMQIKGEAAAPVTFPLLLVEHLGNPLLVYFLPEQPGICPGDEAMTVMLVPGADRKDDLLYLAAFDAAKHAPAGGYRREVEPKK